MVLPKNELFGLDEFFKEIEEQNNLLLKKDNTVSWRGEYLMSSSTYGYTIPISDGTQTVESSLVLPQLKLLDTRELMFIGFLGYEQYTLIQADSSVYVSHIGVIKELIKKLSSYYSTVVISPICGVTTESSIEHYKIVEIIEDLSYWLSSLRLPVTVILIDFTVNGRSNISQGFKNSVHELLN